MANYIEIIDLTNEEPQVIIEILDEERPQPANYEYNCDSTTTIDTIEQETSE